MKQLSIVLGLLLIASSVGAFTGGASSKIKSAEISESELNRVNNEVTIKNESAAEFKTAPVSSLALKTTDFCSGFEKNKKHDQFIKDLSKALDKKGSYDTLVEEIFNSSVICDNPDVFKMTGTWAKLEKEVMTTESLLRGEAFYAENKKHFDAAYKKYGVDPSPILGILRIETNFGENFGEYPLVLHMYNRYFHVDKQSSISRLATWIPMAVEFGWDPYSGGSYAGAFGYPQFMPQKESLHYSADGDGDGKINLFSKADAIHSVARYLKEHGWGDKSNQRVVMRYNHSSEYAKIVLKYREAIKSQVR